MLKLFRIFLLSTLVFIFSKDTQAQTFEAGLIGGVNLSQLNGDLLVGFNRIGFNVGGRVAITPVERWKWNIDILFSQKGSRRSNDDPAFVQFEGFRLNYAEVPIMVSYLDWLNEDGDYFYKLHFTAGVSWARLVDFKVVDINGTDISDLQNFSKNALDLIAGATFYINPNIGINGQFSLAVLDVEKDKDAQSLQGRTLTFRVIYMF